MKNPELVEQYHKRLMDLFRFFDKVCRENNIKYSAEGGTLLGAVRDHGMIPWDADIDVVFTPSELEKFKKAFEKYESRYYFNYIPNHYKGSRHKFIDVRAGRIVDKKCSDAIFGIDVFVIDYLGDDLEYAKKTMKIYQRYYDMGFFTTSFHLPALRSNGKIRPKAVIARVLYPFFYICSKVLSPIYERSYMRFRKKRIDCNSENCKYITIEPFFGRFGIQENTFLKDGYFDLPFGDTKIMCTKNYDMFLSVVYGNYMKLPPIEARVPYPSEDMLTSCVFED